MGNYTPNTKETQQEMLGSIGLGSFPELFSDVPKDVLMTRPLDIPKGLSELELKKKMKAIAAENTVFPYIFRGAGAYDRYIPAIVSSVVSKEEFLTAYTPYQAEISQGVLQSIFEYQTVICALTGMDVSNASVYDGATAAAESAVMCRERKKNRFLISETADPYIRETVKTYCFGNGMEYEEIPERGGVTDIDALRGMLDGTAAGVYIQQPNYYGIAEDASSAGEAAHEAGAKFVMGIDPVMASVIKTPGECGADIAVGEGQSLGMPLSFGGPYLGFMACTSKLMRKLPGRIVGETVDTEGRRGFVLTLQAREQHIKREKAQSNICSNQALCALTATVYCAAMGKDGITAAAQQSIDKAHYLAGKLRELGFSLKYDRDFLFEFVATGDKNACELLSALGKKGILGGLPLGEKEILWCVTEKYSKQDIDYLADCIKEEL